MWALILTVMMASPGVSITTLPGFETRSQCESAGSQWMIDVRAMKWNVAHATCVKVRETR